MDYGKPSGWYQTKDSTTAQHLASPNRTSPELRATASAACFSRLLGPDGWSYTDQVFFGSRTLTLSQPVLILDCVWSESENVLT